MTIPCALLDVGFSLGVSVGPFSVVRWCQADQPFYAGASHKTFPSCKRWCVRCVHTPPIAMPHRHGQVPTFMQNGTLQQNKTLTSFTISDMLCSGVCSVQVIGVRWCKCSGAVITGCWLGRLQFGSGYCGLQHGILHCNDVTGFGGGSCLPPLPPPHPHTYRGVRERRGLCDFFSWTCGAEAVAYDALCNMRENPMHCV